MPTELRDRFIAAVIERLPLPESTGSNVILGIDGIDGAGKTRLADELARVIAAIVEVARVSIDGFHQVRDRRYRRGRFSAEGFWLDSYDYGAFRSEVIEPFRAGTGSYLPAVHDVDSDEVLSGPRIPVPRGCVLLVDGIFLHRRELRDLWDFTIFLDVSFAESQRRMAIRDGAVSEGAESEGAEQQTARYVGGQERYLAECEPKRRASMVVDYDNLLRPTIR